MSMKKYLHILMKHFEANNPFKFKVTNFEIADWLMVDLEKKLNFLCNNFKEMHLQ